MPKNDFLERQLALQKELRCDYVFVAYERAKPKPAGTDESETVGKTQQRKGPPPVEVVQVVPLKLGHHVFMQLSFNILKDRLLRTVAPRPADESTCGTSEESQQMNFKADLVAMYQFLLHYMTSMSQSYTELEEGSSTTGPRGGEREGTRGRGGRGRQSLTHSKTASGRSSASAAPSTVQVPTKKHLVSRGHIRFQLLVEYGADVDAILREGDGKSYSQRRIQAHVQRSILQPNEVAEEEFYSQLGRPSGMAQTCSIM